MLADCCNVFESDLSLCEKYIEYLFQDLEDKCKLIRLNLESMPLPKHRPVVLQSSHKDPVLEAMRSWYKYGLQRHSKFITWIFKLGCTMLPMTLHRTLLKK